MLSTLCYIFAALTLSVRYPYHVGDVNVLHFWDIHKADAGHPKR